MLSLTLINPFASAFRRLTRDSLTNPDHTVQILAFLSLARSYLISRPLVYTQKQEDEKRKRKKSDQSFGGPLGG